MNRRQRRFLAREKRARRQPVSSVGYGEMAQLMYELRVIREFNVCPQCLKPFTCVMTDNEWQTIAACARCRMEWCW